MGRNTGGVAKMRAALLDRLSAIHTATGRKVSIVGWSLGGVYARDLALQAPDMVRCVVTLGKSVRGRRAGHQRAAALRSAVRRNGGRAFRTARGDRGRPAGAGDLDLFAQRRHRELANLSRAPLRIPPKISKSTSPAIPGWASTPPLYGRSRIVWPNPRVNSGNLTDRGRLPLHMRLRNRHNPPKCKSASKAPCNLVAGGNHE